MHAYNSRRRASHRLLAGSALLLGLFFSVPASGQAAPLVERIVFEGVENFDDAPLRGSIMTEETRCRGTFLLRPICRLTRWRLLEERHYLDPQELPLDELRLRTFLHLRGYREAQAGSEVRPLRRGVEVVFHIEEGAPTLLESLDLQQVIPVITQRRIRRAGLPRVGEPLDLVALDTALAHLARRLGQQGYLDAVLHDSVEVRPGARVGRVEILVEPGSPSTVGGFSITGNSEVTDRTIREALRLRPGRPLRTTDIALSQRSLYESNLFHEARVLVPPQGDSAKVLEITVREAPQRGARFGVGFNTVDFVQMEGRLTHYNLFNRGRRLDVRATVGNLFAEQLNARGVFREIRPPMFSQASEREFLTPSWFGSIDYTQPGFRSATQTVGASVFTHRRIIPAIAIDEGIGADLSLTRRIDFGSPLTASYRYELTRVRAGDLFFCINYGICDIPTVNVLQEAHTISPLLFGFFSDRANHPIAATEGYRARLDLEHAASYTNSDFQFSRLSGEAMAYHPLDDLDRRVVAGRVRVGWVRPGQGTGEAIGIGQEHALLHPRHRFYSGGSRSVRGFWENQLGPRVLTIDPNELLGTTENGNGNGNGAIEPGTFCTPAEIVDRTCDPAVAPTGAFIPRPLGGTSVLEGNLELRMRTWGAFTAVVFVDGASVGEGIRELWSGGTSAVTPGVGARVATPVGPVRVDLGVRPQLVQELPVITELVNESGERELVRLQTLRTYDPLAAEDVGFLGRILGRLTLHLSIGEAF